MTFRLALALPIFAILVVPSLRAVAAETSPTFAKDIAPLLYQNCSGCHRPGEVGPFPLLTYEDARKRAKQIAQLTADRVMPPWKPSAGREEFRDARVLDAAQIATFRAWAEAGDAARVPPSPQFPEGWHAGPPDMILQVAKPFRIPAEGPDLYVHFVLPTSSHDTALKRKPL